MKILPLLELIQPKIGKARYSGEFQRKYDAEDSPKFIGGGSFSNVKKNPKDPHTVIKNNRVPQNSGVDVTSNDGYEVYANIIVRKKLYENPHFPRIYEAKRIVDKNGKHINKYELEALIRPDELSDEEIEGVLENFFVVRERRYNGVYDMISGLYDAIKRNDFSGIKSDELKEACKIIQMIDRHYNKPGKRKLYLDLKPDNIMFRRGPTGLIPVLTDPFA